MDTQNQELFLKVQTLLIELFEFSADELTPSAHLRDDLDIDSIDVMAIITKLHDDTGQWIEPATFVELKTLGDVVQALDALLAKS